MPISSARLAAVAAPARRRASSDRAGRRSSYVAVAPVSNLSEGFQIRDVAAGSDFVRLEREALGVNLESKRTGDYFDVTVTNLSGRDRAITLVYSIPVTGQDWKWPANPRRRRDVAVICLIGIPAILPCRRPSRGYGRIPSRHQVTPGT